jgi:two-component system nitrate/nitrite response regulator NarL
MAEPSVLIVEDHAILSHALAGALASAGCGRVDVHDVDRLDADDVLKAVDDLRPDVVLLDLDLGEGRRGVPLIAPIARLGSIVLILTANDDDAALGEALEAGATAVLVKSQPFHELADAVQAAAAGRRLVPVARREELIEAWHRRRDTARKAHERFDQLTASEAAVLEALVDGASLEVIAASRGVAVGTVRSQVKALLRKLQVGSQLAAVARAREAGWPER